MRRSDLTLRQVLLLDKVQKHHSISATEARELRQLNLIEGRAPNYFIAAKVAEWMDQKARYIHNRGLDDDYYRKLILDYLERYGQASRQELDKLIFPKLPDVLDTEKKHNKLRNLLQAMRREGWIQREGPRAAPIWKACLQERFAKEEQS